MKGLLQILRIQLLLPHGTMVINPKATVCLASNVFEVLCVLLMQQCVKCLLLSLPHCMVVSADFIEVSHFLLFPTGRCYSPLKFTWHEA